MSGSVNVEYVRKDGLRLDIRKQAGKRLNCFWVTQGACSDGTYIYMAFERRRMNGHPRAVKIVKIDSNTMKVVAISGPLKVGHANDMTYRRGSLYITHSAGRKVVHCVDAVTLKKKVDIRVGTAMALFFNGIAKYGDGYVLRNMFGSGMIVTDRDFREVRCFNADGGHDVSQSMEQADEVMYRTYSVRQSEDKNFLVLFDMNGRVIKDYKVEMRGELEACFMHKGELWFTSYRKKVINGTLRFMAFIGRFDMDPADLPDPADSRQS